MPELIFSTNAYLFKHDTCFVSETGEAYLEFSEKL